LQEALRWWDHWLKDIDTGLMIEPMLRAWMTDSFRPSPFHRELPGRWIAGPWPSPNIELHRLHLTNAGLQPTPASLTQREVCSPLTVGKQGGAWCPFGRGDDLAGDQRDDDACSLVFDTAPLDASIEILGAPIITLDLSVDRPQANLIVRLCDVDSDGASLRITYGVLNLAHREGHETPTPLEPGRRYRVRIQLNDAGSVIPAGHRIRVAISTAYWPMVWPSAEKATVTIIESSIVLPVRGKGAADAQLLPLSRPETAAPEPTTEIRPGVVRIDRVGLELGTESSFEAHLDGDDPLSAEVTMRQSQTVSRGHWRVRIDTQMRMSCTHDAFRLYASLRACDNDVEVCCREWSSEIPRSLV
jgi:predicted acyl esterase